ncbi:MAG: TRAP transporter substrate-binding protein [Bacteroidetes bacterium]|nr:TRAP transporter substrate-binding protein [Bacteroidota bacterium]
MKKITRKNFFKGLALGTISLPFAIRGCGSDNFAQNKSSTSGILNSKKYQWKCVTTWPPNFPVLGEGAILFSKWVKEMSGGRMEIKVFGGGELVPSLEAFDAVQSGAADMAHGCAYYWAGKSKAAQFFATVPFGMNAQQMNAWIINGGGLELWEELYANFGLIPMPGGNTGVQMGGWFNREINSLADFKGLKMRMPGLGGKVLERAGGAPVLLAGGEIYTGLERGIIDATEWIGPFHDSSMGFHEIAKYYYSPGWHEPGTMLEFFFNKERFEELPEDLQAIMRTAAMRVNHWMLLEFEQKNAEYLSKLTELGVDIRYFPQEVLAELKLYTETIIEELTTEDPFTKKVYDSYLAFRKKASAWSELTEKVFYNSLQNS